MQPHDPNGGKIQRFRSHPKQYAIGSDIVLFSEFRKPAKSCRSGLFLEAQFQKIVNFFAPHNRTSCAIKIFFPRQVFFLYAFLYRNIKNLLWIQFNYFQAFPI